MPFRIITGLADVDTEAECDDEAIRDGVNQILPSTLLDGVEVLNCQGGFASVQMIPSDPARPNSVDCTGIGAALLVATADGWVIVTIGEEVDCASVAPVLRAGCAAVGHPADDRSIGIANATSMSTAERPSVARMDEGEAPVCERSRRIHVAGAGVRARTGPSGAPATQDLTQETGRNDPVLAGLSRTGFG
jgi:hypothetical protein